MTNRLTAIASLILAGLLLPIGVRGAPARHIEPSILGMPSGPWPLLHQGANGVETYFIPTQLAQIRHFPEPERSATLSFIREHQANLSFLSNTMNRFFPVLHSGKLSRVPEYARDLHEVVMAVDPYDARNDNPLYAQEPVLKALPPYTRVLMLVPENLVVQVRNRLKTLGLAERVKTIVSRKASDPSSSDGVTHWVRDIMFVTRDHAGVTVLTSLAYKDFKHVSHNDLGYLTHIAGPGRHVLRMPIFFRGGNVLAVEKGGRRLLLLGREEVEKNGQEFDDAFGFMPPDNAVPDILKAAAGEDEVIVLPNSRTLFHLDSFIAPLGDGVVGLLEPVDPQHLVPVDREVLNYAREFLHRFGFKTIPIPTSATRMANFQSPANIVAFTDRSGRRRALVPQFPEVAGEDPADSLNKRVLAAYRSAGIDPIPVEDRFYPRRGNIHCAVVPLR